MRFDLSWLSRVRRERPKAPNSGVMVGRTLHGDPVTWPAPRRSHGGHGTVVASTGSGKTVLLARILAERIACGSPSDSIFAIDPKYDLIEHLVGAIAATCPARLNDVVVLSPFKGGFPSNLAKLRVPGTEPDTLAVLLAGLVSDVSGSVGSAGGAGIGARQQQLIGGLLQACLSSEHPAASVLWAIDALRLDGGIGLLASMTRSQRARRTLTGLRPSKELAASCISRMQLAFGYTASLERQMAAGSCISPAELLSDGKICLLDLSGAPMGASSLVTFLASLWGRLFLQSALARPSTQSGSMLTIVLEELPLYVGALNDQIVELLQVGRSKGCELVTISQTFKLLERLAPTLPGVMQANSRFLVGRASPTDAEVFVRHIAAPKGVDEPVSAVRSRVAGQLVGLQQREFLLIDQGQRSRFTSLDVDLESWSAAAMRHQVPIAAAKNLYSSAVPTTDRCTLRDAASSAANSNGARAPSADATTDVPVPPTHRPKTPWE